MSPSLPEVVSPPNLLFSAERSPTPPSQVFKGEQRSKALVVLASAIADQKIIAVMQLVNKDPSLAFEMLPMPIRGTSAINQTAPVEFPLACLRNGLSAGYLFAISRGFPVDAPLQNESTTLLQEAMANGGVTSGVADISLLLSLGADYRAMKSSAALYTVVADAFPPKPAKGAVSTRPITPGAVSMLLDAKVDMEYDSGYQCPYSVIVATHGWLDKESASILTKLMARMVKSGLSLDRSTGMPRQTPLQRAMGTKNGEAMIALIRLGAKTGPESLNGKDLFALMTAQGLDMFLPGVQEALMESHISHTSAKHAADAAAAPAAAEPDAQVQRNRRQMRAL